MMKMKDQPAGSSKAVSFRGQTLSGSRLVSTRLSALAIICALLTTAVASADDATAIRQQAGQLLNQARQAMQQGELQQADQFIRQAEQLRPQYDPLTVRFEDTPARARQDLQQLLSGPSTEVASSPTAGSTLEGIPTQTKAAAVAALQRGRQAMLAGNLAGAIGYYHKARASKATFSANEYGPAELAAELQVKGVPANQLLPVATVTPVLSPLNLPVRAGGNIAPLSAPASLQSGGNAFQDGLVSDPNQLAAVPGLQESQLHAARRAMAAGDLRATTIYLAQANQQSASTTPGSDSPAAVQALFQRWQRLLRDKQTYGNHPQLLRTEALLLMEQAEQLLKHGDRQTARQLAEKAQALPVRYQQLDPRPEQLLSKILTPAPAAGSLTAAPIMQQRAEVMRLLSIGKSALDRGDMPTAQQVLQQAEALQVPDEAFAARDMRPWQLRLQIENIQRRSGGVQTAGFDANDGTSGAVQPGVYRPQQDSTQTVQASAGSRASELYEQGLQALAGRDRSTALTHFRAALAEPSSPAMQSQIREKLSLLMSNDNVGSVSTGSPASPLQEFNTQRDVMRQEMFAEIAAEQKAVEQTRVNDPKAALERLLRLRERVEQGQVDDGSRKRMLSIVDRNITNMENYINANAVEIQLSEDSRAVMARIRSDRDSTAETREQLAKLVDSFNKLIDEGRFPEAEMIAKQAREIAPDEPVVQNLIWQSRFAQRVAMQMATDEQKEQGFVDTLGAVDRSSVPFNDDVPYRFDDARDWNELTGMRRRAMERQNSHLSPAGIKIQRALSQPVDVSFTDAPLGTVMDTLGQMTDINVHLDQQGLSAEGVTSNTPVSINLSQPVSLKSALNLILEELRLSYVIRNEVLLITSQMTRDTNVYQEVYNVADLVIAIPDFAPGFNIGLPSAIRDAHNTIGYGGQSGFGNGVPLTMTASGGPRGNSSANVLAQMAASNGFPEATSSGQPLVSNAGQGGAAMADFDSLIELITTTIKPDSWEDVGGAGTISEFRSNLSLVVSQTQQVHEEIRDLLDQLRRLQDLQITIEVRFITLNDNFYERIGIDFDFEIDDNVNVDDIQDDYGPSVMIGLDSQGPTVDLDLVFDQGDAFNAAVPAFGAYDAGTAAQFGFAILSDIEVFFLLQAATGDTRTNVLTAPKVTLFNGQQASVSDTSQRPFVTGVVPVVGDFAAAHQPVVVVLSEGTNLSVRAVCSNDRRFVRLTLVPFFSTIGQVEEFTFSGSQTTSIGETVLDSDGQPQARNNQVMTTEGTTVQLPTFNFTTVSTTVSVPDGGTVLLGGIKRLSEGRTERGVPMLAQLPYISRLFKNVGIGRETQSLMMMVTPRIIIQEEEELAQTGLDSSQL
jgi:general secretion pathway protein D